MAEKITRKLVNELGVLSRSESGWSKELNLVSWNGRVAKLDIREWSSKKEKLGKGITLKKSEAIRLRDVLNNLDFSLIPDSDNEPVVQMAPESSVVVEEIAGEGVVTKEVVPA